MNTEALAILRQRKVLLAAGAGVVVLLIWFLAVFSPEGHKLAAVNQKAQAAEVQQTALQARLARLRSYSKESAEFEALGARLADAVPPTADVYDYITAISNAAASARVTVAGINPSSALSSKGVAVIPVSVSATGTYDQTLAFIKALYALPRLTVITQISISGGGTGSSRSSSLSDQFSLDILAQPSALPVQTPSG